MAHTINASYPIYDDRIAKAFAFSRPAADNSFNRRLDSFMAFYGRLREAYAQILAEGLLNPALTDFRTKFPEQVPFLPEIKIVDFIFWSTGTLIRDGMFPNVPNQVFDLTPND